MATIVVDEQRERHHIQEIGDGQVEHIDVVFGEIGPGPPNLQYDNGIEREPQQEDNGVHNREQNTFEILLVRAAGVGDVIDVTISVCICEGFTAHKVQRGLGDDTFCEEGAKMS